MNPITYPARPVQGGKLELAPPKRGIWFAEPKYNGWRALVHCPSGTMWNRHGSPLTIAECFRKSLRKLTELSQHGLVWADCEALERRHTVGCGSLIVLDCIPEAGAPTYIERKAFLTSLAVRELIEFDQLSTSGIGSFQNNAVLLSPSIPDNGGVLNFYRYLQDLNRRLKADFYEGVVMKRGDAPYPVQLRNSKEEFPGMVKHRFLT